MFEPKTDAVAAEMAAMRERLEVLEARQRRSRRLAMAVGALLTCSLAGVAFASGPCANGLPFCFNANEPAIASEVNANFAALKTWLEAKVGATGPLGTPSTSIVTSGATVNGNLSVSGNVTASALSLSSSLLASGPATINGAFISNGWQIECSSFSFAAFSCRMNVRTGLTECRNGVTATVTSWSGVSTIFNASTDGRYSLSCAAYQPNSNWPMCCRTSSSGSTQCVINVMGNGFTATPDPF